MDLTDAEQRAGLRCINCREPVLKGTEFMKVSVQETVNGVAVGKGTVTVCDRDSCDDFRATMEGDATAWREVEWTWR